MKLVEDDDQFDKLQMRLLREIVESIRDGLRECGVENETIIVNATEDIAFSIAAIVDGSRVMDLDGSEVLPILTFARKRGGDELICAKGGGSWMHEYAFGIAEEVFEDEEPLPDDGDRSES